MATNKECECIKSALASVMLASSLENNGMLASRGEVILKEEITLADGTKIRNINDLIQSEASKLRDEWMGIAKNCDLTGFDKMYLDNLTEGRSRLEKVIDSRGSDFVEAQFAGARINDTIQDIAFKKKLIRCKD